MVYLLHIQYYCVRNQCLFEIIHLLKTSGLLLAFATVLLQIVVFLQPLFPEQYQVAPVCETISNTLRQHRSETAYQHPTFLAHSDHGIDHSYQHDVNHHCPYCTFYGTFILPPELSIKEILIRVHIRLLAYRHRFKHIYFVLQQLYLLPQSRAPPISLAI